MATDRRVGIVSLMLVLSATACRMNRTTDARRTIEVRADRGWQDSGVMLDGKSPFTLRYVTGEVRDRDLTITNASGSDYVCGRADCCEPMPRVRRGALVGRIGRDVFDVSNGGRFTRSQKGALFLRINDCDAALHDNQGTLTIEFIPEIGAVTGY
jgi:hypothetical protein